MARAVANTQSTLSDYATNADHYQPEAAHSIAHFGLNPLLDRSPHIGRSCSAT